MNRDFLLPDLGEGLTESEVVSWRVDVGDAVELYQVIADIETAKAVVELPSPVAGTVTALHAEVGQTVDVGAALVSFEVGERDAAAPSRDSELGDGAATAADADGAADEDGGVEADGEVEDESTRPNLVGYGAAKETGVPKRRARVAQADAASAAPAAAAPSTDTTPPAERPRSTPPVRKLAHDLGVDLEHVEGSGPRGLITREDVRRMAGIDAAAATSSEDDAATEQDGGAQVRPQDSTYPDELRIPIRGVRKHTAAAMVASAFTAPHVTEFLTVDVTATSELLERLGGDRRFADHRITMLTVVAKALCIAVARNPSLNSRWDEENHEIVQLGRVNLGIAAATDRGLLVPTVADAHRQTLGELADSIRDLTAAARAGTTTSAAMTGGTITITNIGVYGIDAGTPILVPGEAAILALGAVRRQPWEHRGEVALRDVVTLSLSFDHRIVDGEQGSRFLADIGEILRDPAAVLTMV